MRTKRRYLMLAAILLLPFVLFRFFLFFAGRNIRTPLHAWINAPRPVDRELLEAARQRDFVAAKIAIGRGANVNVVDDARYQSCTESNPGRTYFTPLIFASSSRNSDLVQLLLMHGADASAADGNQRTPLHIAASIGNVDSVKELLARGATTEARDYFQSTPLIDTAYSGHTEVILVLLDHGAKINAKDRLQFTALLRAVTGGNPAMLKLLLERGADVQARNSQGQSALHYAVEYGCWQALPILLAHGADLQAPNKAGQTPLKMALEHGQSGWSFYRARENAARVADQRRRMIDILKEAGAKP